MAATDGFTGMAFPFRVDPETGGVAVSTTGANNLAHIADAITQIIGTSPALREVWHLPDFGANPGNLLWEPIDGALASAVETYTKGGLRKWEDRVRFEAVLLLDQVQEGKVILHLDVLDVVTFSRAQLNLEVPT